MLKTIIFVIALIAISNINASTIKKTGEVQETVLSAFGTGFFRAITNDNSIDHCIPEEWYQSNETDSGSENGQYLKDLRESAAKALNAMDSVLTLGCVLREGVKVILAKSFEGGDHGLFHRTKQVLTDHISHAKNNRAQEAEEKGKVYVAPKTDAVVVLKKPELAASFKQEALMAIKEISDLGYKAERVLFTVGMPGVNAIENLGRIFKHLMEKALKIWESPIGREMMATKGKVVECIKKHADKDFEDKITRNIHKFFERLKVMDSQAAVGEADVVTETFCHFPASENTLKFLIAHIDAKSDVTRKTYLGSFLGLLFRTVGGSVEAAQAALAGKEPNSH
jgi:hypothetical protein